MKPIARSLLWFALFAATFASAQNTNNLPNVQHVIIVIQENRTPDNLFNQDQALMNNGAHVQPSFAGQPANSGPCTINGVTTYIPLSSTSLFTCWDTGHNHGEPPDWINMWNKGKMDGACQISVGWRSNGYVNCNPHPPSC